MARHDKNGSRSGGCSTANGPVSRRAFLRLLAFAGLAVPVVSMVGCKSGDGGAEGKVDAFKLSRNGRRSCNACRNHARYKIFSSAQIADAHRAHPGCNCVIKLVRIPKAEADNYFADFPYYDRRSGNG